MELKKTFRFEASHVLPLHPGKCSRLHGHSWVLYVYVRGEIQPENGMVQDYAEINEVMKPVIANLDHKHLGAWKKLDVSGHAFWEILPKAEAWRVLELPKDFYPTSENLLMWLADQITDKLPLWSKLELEETCTSSAILTRYEWSEEKRRRQQR